MTSTPTAGGRIYAVHTPKPTLLSAACTLGLTQTTTTPADIPGCSITLTTANPNASVLVIGVFDISVVTGAAAVAVGNCVVDGSAQNGEATQQLVTTGLRQTVSQVWNVVLATATSHTIKLQGALTANAGSATYNSTHTTLTLTVYDW